MRQLKITKQITNKADASLDIYLQEINRERLITAEEEIVLAERIKQGDALAVEKLTKANLRFVVSVAKQFQNRGLPLCDLINEGNIGLIKAAKRFDATRGFKLITYAVWFIRQSILQAINEQSQLVRLPPKKVDAINKVRKAVKRMEQEFQREPSFEEIGKELSLSAQAVDNIMGLTTRQVSIDAPLGGTEELTLMDIIQDQEGQSTEHYMAKESLNKEIANVFTSLDQREGDVLRLYFGFDDKDPMTFEGIAGQLGIGVERVRQIKDKALRRLRHISRSALLKEYLS